MPRTIELKETRFVPVAADVAVARVADFHRISEWDPSILESKRTDAGGDTPLVVGATFDLVLKFMGAQSEMTYRLIELTPTRAQLDGVGGNISAIDVVEAVDVPSGGCNVTWAATLTFNGVASLALPFLRPALNRLGVGAVDGLQTWLTTKSKEDNAST